MHPHAVTTHRHESRPAEICEVARHRRLRQPQAVVKVADADLVVAEQRQDAEPGAGGFRGMAEDQDAHGPYSDIAAPDRPPAGSTRTSVLVGNDDAIPIEIPQGTHRLRRRIAGSRGIRLLKPLVKPLRICKAEKNPVLPDHQIAFGV